MPKSLAVLLFTLALASCSADPELGPAPAGDRAALERLADAWKKVSDSAAYGTNPRNMAPEDRKSFVVTIFRQAGFDYTATLHQLATAKINAQDTLIKDLAQLIMLPHANSEQPVRLEDIYSTAELTDIRALEVKLR